MLILNRKPGQSVRIGKDILITVEWIRGQTCRLSFDAPRDVTVWREEIWQASGGQPGPAVEIQEARA